MKKLLLTICAVGALTLTGAAQGERKSAPAGSETQMTPEQRAESQTKKAIAVLNLTATQQTEFKKLLLDKIKLNQPLKEKAKSTTDANEKQKLIGQVKANNEKFYTSVNAMLTAEQQPKWAEHKKKMEAKQGEHQD